MKPLPRRAEIRGIAPPILAAGIAIVLLVAAACTPTAGGQSTTLVAGQAAATTAAVSATSATLPGAVAASPAIVIGVEYILLDNARMIERQADMLGEVGFGASKPIGEAIDWGTMQSSPDAPIDFSKLDKYVVEFHAAGFRKTVLALKSHSLWASVDHARLRSKNAAPKPEYRDLYARWITAVVERYDGDGIDDLPGLSHPVRHYEIGSEFSSYEPEPVEEYLAMLEIAYEAAHAAFPDVVVSHAAFLVTDFLIGDPDPKTLSDDTGVDRYGPQTFSEIRAILDRPDLFDVINVHALAHPGEIEQMVRWLGWETGQRGYTRPIIISDTSINPFVAFGPAIDWDRVPQLMGLTFYPATEDDRCRIADYFSRVLDEDARTVAWMRAFVAADMVKKVVIAAEQRIELINTAFTTDLPILDTRLGQAGAGNAGWGGMIEIGTGTRYPNFYAMQQLIRHIDGYASVVLLDIDGPDGTRVYEFTVGGVSLWVAWYDPPYLVLHGDSPVEATITVPTGSGTVVVEPMIDAIGQTEPVSTSAAAEGEGFLITLDQTPVFMWRDDS